MLFVNPHDSPHNNTGAVPKNIISLVPSQTELLIDLECNIVGRTKFCVHPSSDVAQIPIIGGTKQLRLETICRLQPDLIVANKEENNQEDILYLAERFPVFLTDICSVANAVELVRDIGIICNKIESAEKLALKLQTAYTYLKEMFKTQEMRVAYLIWDNPIMVAAGSTYIHQMMQWLGMENVFGHLERYPEISMEELADAKPTHIFLSSEPFPFKEKHIGKFSNQLETSRVILADGEQFSWYGTRILKSNNYFNQLLNCLQLTQ
jgi:ABC-type Fe3+-hydroxamate transport system substrate-binding protein